MLKHYVIPVEILQEIEKILVELPAKASLKVLNALYKEIDEQNEAQKELPKKDE